MLRNCQTNFKKAMSVPFSLADAAADAAGMFSTLNSFASQGTSGALAATTGLITFITTYNFQAAVLRGEKDAESSSNKNRTESSRSSTILTMLFALFTAITFYVRWHFLYAATKAWSHDLNNPDDHNSEVIASLTPGEEVFVALYFLVVTLPFTLSTDIYETVKKHINQDSLYSRLLRPLSGDKTIYCFRWLGSLGHTVEHVLGILVLIPPSTLQSWAKAGRLTMILNYSYLVPLIALLTGAIFLKTFLFEGDTHKNNLLAVRGEPVHKDEDDAVMDWSCYSKTAKLLHHLLWLGGPAEGFDTMWPIATTIAALGLGYGIPIAAVAGLASWYGYHYSEIQESRTELSKNAMAPFESFERPKIPAGDEENAPLLNNIGIFATCRQRLRLCAQNGPGVCFTA